MESTRNTVNMWQNVEKARTRKLVYFYVAIVALFLAIGPWIFSSNWISSSDSHSCIEITGSLLAFVAGIACLMHLNMPGIGGKEFLKRIKQDEDMVTIPVVVLTTSDSEQDILESYRLHAAGYVKKPIDLQEFHGVVTKLNDYWFSICKRVHEESTCIRN